MIKMILSVCVILVLLGAPVYGEVLVLSDGTVVNAKIVSRDNKALKVELDGEQVSFNLNQIVSIDGKPFDLKASTVNVVSKEQMSKELSSLVEAQKASQAKIEIIRSKSKREALKKFVDLMGTRELMAKNFDQMLANMHPKYRSKMRKVLNVDEIIDNLLPLYDKHFTQDELDYYISFYSSPSGKKLQATIPVIMKESVDINMEYLKGKIPKDIQ